MLLFVLAPPLFVAVASFAALGANNLAAAGRSTTRLTGEMAFAKAAAKTVRASPHQALFERESPPQCELSRPPEGVPANEARVVMLDYQRQCYRQLVEIQRAKLHALREIMSKNRAYKSRNWSLLERQPLPQCELAKAPEDVPANEARIVKLDYERQCYRHVAAIERARLNAVQDAARRTVKAVKHPRRTVYKPVRRQPRFMTY
jgi:hypothetical protein